MLLKRKQKICKYLPLICLAISEITRFMYDRRLRHENSYAGSQADLIAKLVSCAIVSPTQQFNLFDNP